MVVLSCAEIEQSMSDDFEPFFSSGEAESISEQYPDLQSLSVEIEMSKIAGEDVGYRHYDEGDLPSHIQCPECGERVSIGWTVADHIDEKETDFEETESCHGQIYEGKSCVVMFEINGTASYV